LSIRLSTELFDSVQEIAADYADERRWRSAFICVICG
jgi:hypothetical protein